MQISIHFTVIFQRPGTLMVPISLLHLQQVSVCSQSAREFILGGERNELSPPADLEKWSHSHPQIIHKAS